MLIVDAIQFTGKNKETILEFMDGDVENSCLDNGMILVRTINNKEIILTIKPNYWVVRDRGIHYCYSKEEFNRRYENI